MDDVRILRTAAIELCDADSADVVKVAGILRRITNWWKAFRDPEYRKQIDALRDQSLKVNNLLTQLGSEIEALQSAIADADISSYENALRNVREMSTNLAAILKTYNVETQKVESNAPKDTVDVPTPEDTPEQEGPARLPYYTKTQLEDPTVREQLKTQLPPDYDVPVGIDVSKPVLNFNWFSSVSPNDFYLSEHFISFFQRHLAEAMARKISITADPDYNQKVFLYLAQMPEVEKQLREQIPVAAISGTLVRVDFQTPSTKVTHRTANEMRTEIQTAPFTIVFPPSDYFDGPKRVELTVNILFNDMRAAYVRGQRLGAFGDKYLRIIGHDFPVPQQIAEQAVARTNEITKLAQQNIHQWARNILIQAFRQTMGREPSLAELQLAQAVSWRESNYGRGWKSSKNPDGRAVGSNNWGAVQSGMPRGGVCPVGSFMYTDTHPTSQGTSVPYQVCFKTYATPVDGAADVVRLLFKSKSRAEGIQQAARSGSIQDFSTVMYDTHYYEGFGKTREQRIAGHTKWIQSAINTITKALNERTQFNDVTRPSESMIAARPTQTEQDAMQEYSVLMRQLAASAECGPIERIARRVLEEAFLPNTRVLLVIGQESPMPVRMRYARILASALREELGAETSIHHQNDRLEMECDVRGPEQSVLLAVQGLSEGVANAFAMATKLNPITVNGYVGLESKYPLLDPDTSETNFRKFAFEIMGRHGL